MEPGFHLGDLAIVRQEETYKVGDIVTYRNAELGKSVIHRIIELAEDHFILKGDNNSWIDTYQPTQAEIIGKLWIFVPTMGKAIEWVRTPIHMALIIAIMGGVFMISNFKSQRGKSTKQPATNWGWREISLAVLGLFILIFLFLGILAFTRSTVRPSDSVPYQQVGMFYYSAAGTAGVYDSDTVHSGEPVFPKLTCVLSLGFGYSLTGDLIQDVSGTQQLSARVSDDQSGWQRTILMKEYTPFNGPSFSSSATLDLCQIEALVATVEQETGFHPNTYTLTIIPYVAAAWKMGDQDFRDMFEPHLVFKFDKLHFYLTHDSTQLDPLYYAKKGSANRMGEKDNILPLLGLEFKVMDVRIVSVLGLCLALAGALLLGRSLYNTAKDSQDALIRIRYGSLLADIYDRGLENLSPIIEVTTIDDLAKIAERQNTMILHTMRDSLHFYFAQSAGTTYRYVISDAKTTNKNQNIQK